MVTSEDYMSEQLLTSTLRYKNQFGAVSRVNHNEFMGYLALNCLMNNVGTR